MEGLVLGVFAAVYAGMFLGGFPRLRLDRTAVALLGAIALLAGGVVTLGAAGASVDLPTLVLLFGLMVVSAQLQLGGFYARVAAGIATADVSAPALLALHVGVTGLLAAVFTNDVVCLAMAPMWIDACARRRLDPVPFLLGLACAANVGSAATLIGNPQNMLIGQTLELSFNDYLVHAALPSGLGLVAVWAILAWQQRGRWNALSPAHRDPLGADATPFDAWQSAKGLLVVGLLLVSFIATPWPREITALAAAGVLLPSRRLLASEKLARVDWPLLVLFIGLFVVNGALEATGVPARAVASLRDAGIDLASPDWFFAATVVLANLVSNVPAVMLLLPHVQGPDAGTLLALASTLAGNLILVGSIANLIVADAAAQRGIAIDWRRHARAGIPITIATLVLARSLVGVV